MPWVRKFFKEKQKVWVEVDDDGEFVLDDKGRAMIRYKVDDEENTYSASLRNIGADAPSSSKSSESAAKASTSTTKKTKKAKVADIPDVEGDKVISTDVPDVLANEPPPEDGVIEIYTDGACQGNPGPCSYGIVIRFGEHYKEISQYLGHGTNNIGELMGIFVALGALKRKDLPVRLHTDSSYSIGVLTQGWKAKANKELITKARALVSQFDDLELVKVKGHAGVPLNERVDRLAVGAIERERER